MLYNKYTLFGIFLSKNISSGLYPDFEKWYDSEGFTVSVHIVERRNFIRERYYQRYYIRNN